MAKAGSIFVQASDHVSLVDSRIFSGVEGTSSGAYNTAVGNGGDINFSAKSLSLARGSRLETSTAGEGNAGDINLNLVDYTNISGISQFGKSSGLFTTTEASASGRGGNIRVKTGVLNVSDGAVLSARTNSNFDGGKIAVDANTLEVTNGGQLLTTAFSSGNAGNITVTAADQVIFDGSDPNFAARLSQFSQVDADGSASGLSARTIGTGAAGDLTITTGRLTVQNGAQLSATTLGSGNAGEIRVSASDAVNITGVAMGGISSGLFTNTSSTGQGGNIVIDTNALGIANGAVLDARTTGSGRGGSITLNPRTFDVTNGGQVLTTTSSNGRAGDIAIAGLDRLTISGSGSGLFANTASNSSGEGGNVAISSNNLAITDSAGIAVSSQGRGNAGTITIQAGAVNLDRRAFLSAETTSSEGGNITLQSQGLLLMRRGSRVSTTAGTANAGGNGGNINIDTQFIVAVPSENSDIRANAYTGNGGNIRITTQGIFGIQFRPQDTPLSDITASSTLGVNGAVEINTPGIDPSRGLSTLPAQPVVAQVAQDCYAGGSQAESSFTVTGRGGLPPNLREALSNDAADVAWVTLNPGGENRSGPTASTDPTSLPPVPLVEAQGWEINSKGEVVLTATAPTATPRSSWRRPIACSAQPTK